MQAEWNDHVITVRGSFTYRWFWLAPTYELWIDDTQLDSSSGPVVHPSLEAIYVEGEGDDEVSHHIHAELVSVLGVRPRCDVLIGDEVLSSGRVRVENLINPILVFVILISVSLMGYIGPEALRALVSRFI